MKKLLSLVVLACAMAATVGCEDKKSTGSTPPKMTSSGGGAAHSSGSH